MEECIFCKIARKEIQSNIVDETENFLAFLDIHPKVKNHTLIIPKKHFSNLIEMNSELSKELIDFIKKIAKKYLKEGAKGFNLIVNNGEEAGQVIKHLHFHILPRKRGDSFKLNL